jgi:hypothetical protein
MSPSEKVFRDYGPGNPSAKRLANLKRRVKRARQFPINTCPASRHLHRIALQLACGNDWWTETEPQHCAESMLSVLESLWKLRTKSNGGGDR